MIREEIDNLIIVYHTHLLVDKALRGDNCML